MLYPVSMENRLTSLFVILGAVALLIGQSLFVVGQTEQALVLQFGEFKASHTTPGLKAKLPFVQTVVKYPRLAVGIERAPTSEITLLDQKRLVVDAFAYYKIVDPLMFFKNFTEISRAENALSGRMESTLREVLGRYPLAAVLSERRQTIMTEIRNQLNKELVNSGMEVINVRLRQADLPEANSTAIVRRMISEREREARELRSNGEKEAQETRAKADKERTIKLAEAEREAQNLRGRGDSEAIKIHADAYGTDPKFYEFYRSLEAYRTALTSQPGSGSQPTFVLSPGSQFMSVLSNGSAR